jgi:mannose-6-phosphate isomerase-like protein (cupin superfamily)
VTGGLPPFPGAIGVSHLRVYDSEAPDGLRGGTPHLHTACTEAYAVVRGHGVVQTLSGDGHAEVPLEPGAFVWFTPGTVHRLVNHSGDLEILVLMQNAGLPEAGDLVVTFTPERLDDPAAYADAAVLPPDALTTASGDEAARRRRDLGVEGFVWWRDQVDKQGPGALRPLYERAAALVEPLVDAWRAVWRAAPLAAVEATAAQLDALGHADGSHLAESSVHRLPAPPDERRYGCCGTLGVYVAGPWERDVVQP